MNEYKSKDVQSLFDISGETVRTWSNEFQQYLSPTANPGIGRHRLFTLDDLRVFMLVAQVKQKGKTYEDAHVMLATGQRGELPDGIEDGIDILDNSLQLDLASRKVSQLTDQVRTLREENIRLQTLLEKAKQDLEKAAVDHKELRQLERQIGRLEAMLEMERDKDE